MLLYEYAEGEDEDDIQLSMIESDEEFDAAAAEFDRLMEEEEDLDNEE